MQTSEMKYLRKVVGKTRRDQIMNTKIRNQLKQESVEVLMGNRTLRWYVYAIRMESERKPKLVLEARPEGGRGKSRPRVEWEECGRIGKEERKTVTRSATTCPG
jgi:hypothetical protein